MNRLLVTYIGMLILLAVFVTPIMSQEEICEDLRGLHAEHGDVLFEYLSDTGEDCINETQTLSPSAPTDNVIWSESGQGSMAIPVTLELSQGTYSLNLIKPSQEGHWGNALLDEVISVTDNCFLWSTSLGPRISFSSLLPIEQDCRLYATLAVEMPYGSNTAWEVSIAKLSDAPPITPNAQDWSAEGRGMKFLPFDISFDPGIYRVNVSDPSLVGDIQFYTTFELPDHCFPGGTHLDLPTQIRIEKNCRIISTLSAYLYRHDDNDDAPWEVSITKLD